MLTIMVITLLIELAFYIFLWRAANCIIRRYEYDFGKIKWKYLVFISDEQEWDTYEKLEEPKE